MHKVIKNPKQVILTPNKIWEDINRHGKITKLWEHQNDIWKNECMRYIMAQKRSQRRGEKFEVGQQVLLKVESPRQEWTKGEIK